MSFVIRSSGWLSSVQLSWVNFQASKSPTSPGFRIVGQSFSVAQIWKGPSTKQKLQSRKRCCLLQSRKVSRASRSLLVLVTALTGALINHPQKLTDASCCSTGFLVLLNHYSKSHLRRTDVSGCGSIASCHRLPRPRPADKTTAQPVIPVGSQTSL